MSFHSHTPARTLDEQGNHCFACGSENPHGLHLHFTVDATDPAAPSVSAAVSLNRNFEGPPGYVHGGIIATLLDEAMVKLSRPLGVIAMTRHMEVDYLRPVPLDVPLTLTAQHDRREGRKLFHSAELRDATGSALARSKGVIVVIDPSLLTRAETH